MPIPLTPTQVACLREDTRADHTYVRLAMFLANVTQDEVAAGVDLPQGYVSRVIRGTAKIPLVTARRFARYFGCEVDDLFPDDQAAPDAAKTNEVSA